MKLNKFFIALSLLIFAVSTTFIFSCQKEAVDAATPQTVISKNLSLSSANFEDGLLVFPSSCELNNFTNDLEKESFSSLPAIESKFGFKSLKSKLDKELLRLNKEKPAVYDTEYFKYNSEHGVYEINYAFYFMSSAFDENGLVKLDGKIVKFTNDKIYAADPDLFTDMSKLTTVTKTNEALGVIVTEVGFEDVTDKMNINGTNPENGPEKEFCWNEPPTGAAGFLEGQCNSAAIAANVIVRVYSIKWACPYQGGYLHCARVWSVINSYNSAGQPTLSIKANVVGNFTFQYFYGGASFVTIKYFNVTSGPSATIHTMTLYERVGESGCLLNSGSNSALSIYNGNITGKATIGLATPQCSFNY